MNKNFILILLCLTALILTSCSDLTSEKRFKEDIYTVTGILYAGQTVNLSKPVIICKTVDTNNINIQNMIVTDAQVQLTDLSDNSITPLVFGANPATGKLGYYDPTFSLIVQKGHTYRLNIQIADKSISAETTVPDSISFIDIPGYSVQNIQPYETVVYDQIDLYHRIKIQTYSPENLNLLVEYYCMENWTDVEYTLTMMGSPTHPEEEDDYEDPMTGSPRLHRGYYNYKPQAENGNYFVDLGFNQLSYSFYGNYEVRLYSIDNNYFSYLYKFEGYKYGGIHNGYGYFGSANGQKIWTKVIK